MEAVPGVTSATVAISVPPYSTGLTDIDVPGKEKLASSYAVSDSAARIIFVRSGFCYCVDVFSPRAMLIQPGTSLSSIRRLLEAFSGSEEPIGQKVRFPSWELNYSDWPVNAYLEIIGVVADIKNKSLRDPTMSQIYLPFTISATGLADDRTIIVKTAGS